MVALLLQHNLFNWWKEQGVSFEIPLKIRRRKTTVPDVWHKQAYIITKSSWLLSPLKFRTTSKSIKSNTKTSLNVNTNYTRYELYIAFGNVIDYLDRKNTFSNLIDFFLPIFVRCRCYSFFFCKFNWIRPGLNYNLNINVNKNQDWFSETNFFTKLYKWRSNNIYILFKQNATK